MGTSKILIDGVGIDLTQDTVAANKMLNGTKAHDSDGDSITGTIQTWTGTQASGTKNIAANGTFDVSEYASAVVNVEGICKKYDVTVTSDVTANTFALVTNDSWLATHYNDANLIVYVVPPIGPQDIKYSFCGIRSNKAIFGTIDALSYGYRYYHSSGSAVSSNSIDTPISGANNIGLPGALSVNSNGTLTIGCASTYPLRAGEYTVYAMI